MYLEVNGVRLGFRHDRLREGVQLLTQGLHVVVIKRTFVYKNGHTSSDDFHLLLPTMLELREFIQVLIEERSGMELVQKMVLSLEYSNDLLMSEWLFNNFPQWF
jgi:hypothetical protein